MLKKPTFYVEPSTPVELELELELELDIVAVEVRPACPEREVVSVARFEREQVGPQLEESKCYLPY